MEESGTTRKIQLTNGEIALVSARDYDYLSQFTWRPSGRGYATRDLGAKKRLLMHREILGAPNGIPVDHANGQKLDNRRENIRLCSPAENSRNCRVIRNKHGFKGVKLRALRKYRGRLVPQTKRYVARIKLNGKKFDLGCFYTPEEAARAYDLAAVQHFGAFAATNSDLLGNQL